MEVIIVGDESKMKENFTKIMFEITLEHIKKGEEIPKKEKIA